MGAKKRAGGKPAKGSARSHERRALRLLEQLGDIRGELAEAEGSAFEALVGELNGLRNVRRDRGIEMLDTSIMEELVDLLQKYRMAKQSQQPPPPDMMWAILEEMLRLILKLVCKAWYLQQMQPPEFPRPTPPGPTT